MLAILLLLFCLFLFAVGTYRLMLAIVYLVSPIRSKPSTSRIFATQSPIRFSVLIPACDEEATIRTCLASLDSVDYPSKALSVFVIADNCADETASIAAELGVVVLERHDATTQGKGAALAWALERIPIASTDAVAIVDADTVVDRDFFNEMASKLQMGHRILQGFDGVANPGDTPLTRLMAVTNTMKNLLYNGGKSELGLSPLLMGTGMVFSRSAIEAHPWRAKGIVENLEQSILLIEAGERIVFVPNAIVRAHEATTLVHAYTQRQRWASGQVALTRIALRAVCLGIARRKPALLDAGLDIVLPLRYSRLLYLTCASAAITAVLAADILFIPLACVVLQGVEFAIGVALHGDRTKLASAVAFALPFLAWKLSIDLLALGGFRRSKWERARRDSIAPPS